MFLQIALVLYSMIQAKLEFVAEFQKVHSSIGSDYEYCLKRIDIELVDECIKSLKKGKACGPGNISAEQSVT